MAITRAKLGASPNILRYSANGNAGDNLNITAATIIGDCATGPLKDKLTAADAAGDAAWTALNNTDMEVSVLNGGYIGNVPNPVSVIQGGFNTIGGPRNFGFTCGVGSAVVNATLEVRYNAIQGGVTTGLASLDTTPYALRYTFTCGNPGAAVSKTAAQIIADCAEGPLKRLLERADADGDTAWAALGHADGAVSVHVGGANGLTTGTVGLGLGSFEALSPNTRTFVAKVLAGGLLPCVLEIRFNHTLVR